MWYDYNHTGVQQILHRFPVKAGKVTAEWWSFIELWWPGNCDCVYAFAVPMAW